MTDQTYDRLTHLIGTETHDERLLNTLLYSVAQIQHGLRLIGTRYETHALRFVRHSLRAFRQDYFVIFDRAKQLNAGSACQLSGCQSYCCQ